MDARFANFKHVFAGRFQQGGFATQAPVVISQPVQPQAQVVEVSAMAAFDEEQVRLFLGGVPRKSQLLY